LLVLGVSSSVAGFQYLRGVDGGVLVVLLLVEDVGVHVVVDHQQLAASVIVA
jgi:hypothetical protein